MGIGKGIIDQDHRYDSVAEGYLFERIDPPGEEHTARLLQGLGGRCGFVLNEVPVLDTLEPTIVTRINPDTSEDIFDETNTAPSALQFKINYTQEDSIVYLPVSEVGKVFRVQYTCKGAGQHVQNIKALVNTTINFNTNLDGFFKSLNGYDKIINAANVYLLGKRATVRNCLVQGASVVRGNVDGKVSFYEVNGDLTLERGSVLSSSGVVLIVYGSLKVTGSGADPKIKGINPNLGDAGELGAENGPGDSGGGDGGAGGLKLMEAPTGYNSGGQGGGGGTHANSDAPTGGSPGGSKGTLVPFTQGLGGSGLAGQAGNTLFGAGGMGADGQDSYSVNSGDGGKGGASGGAGLYIIVFGEIDPDIIFETGKGIDNSESGPFTLVSRFDSITNTVDVTAEASGVDGTIEYINLTERSDTNSNILAEFGYFECGSINI